MENIENKFLLTPVLIGKHLNENVSYPQIRSENRNGNQKIRIFRISCEKQLMFIALLQPVEFIPFYLSLTNDMPIVAT